MKPFSLALLSAALLSIAPTALAQADRANLTGTVTDPSGAIIAGASATAVAKGTALTRTVQTTSSGTYFIPALPIGVYTVAITHPGFRTSQFEGITLAVGQTLTQDVRLEVVSTDTSVEVLASAPPLERSSAEISGVIEAEQIKEIP